MMGWNLGGVIFHNYSLAEYYRSSSFLCLLVLVELLIAPSIRRYRRKKTVLRPIVTSGVSFHLSMSQDCHRYLHDLYSTLPKDTSFHPTSHHRIKKGIGASSSENKQRTVPETIRQVRGVLPGIILEQRRKLYRSRADQQ